MFLPQVTFTSGFFFFFFFTLVLPQCTPLFTSGVTFKFSIVTCLPQYILQGWRLPQYCYLSLSEFATLNTLRVWSLPQCCYLSSYLRSNLHLHLVTERSWWSTCWSAHRRVQPSASLHESCAPFCSSRCSGRSWPPSCWLRPLPPRLAGHLSRSRNTWTNHPQVRRVGGFWRL